MTRDRKGARGSLRSPTRRQGPPGPGNRRRPGRRAPRTPVSRRAHPHDQLSRRGGGGFPPEADDLLWTLDPIDGTVNYSADIPLCAVSLALIHDHQPILGVIDLPLLQARYWATDGGGAFLNRRPLQIAGISTLAERQSLPWATPGPPSLAGRPRPDRGDIPSVSLGRGRPHAADEYTRAGGRPVTSADLGVREPGPQCGAGASGTLNCRYEHERQTPSREAPLGGPSGQADGREERWMWW